MKKTLIICSLVIAMLCTSCSKTEPALTDSSSSEQAISSDTVSSAPVSSEISSEVSSETPSSVQASSVPTSSETVTSAPPSSAVSSKAPKAESKAQASSKASTSSMPPKTASSKAESKPVADDTPDFGELMDETVVDAIIAEGIEYANSKGMTWKDDYTVEGNGYYNPAFSGHGEEAFRRDLFYNIDQIYHLNVDDPDYDAELYNGCTGYYKIVKEEFHEKGYWYGFVLY